MSNLSRSVNSYVKSSVWYSLTLSYTPSLTHLLTHLLTHWLTLLCSLTLLNSVLSTLNSVSWLLTTTLGVLMSENLLFTLIGHRNAMSFLDWSQKHYIMLWLVIEMLHNALIGHRRATSFNQYDHFTWQLYASVMCYLITRISYLTGAYVSSTYFTISKDTLTKRAEDDLLHACSVVCSMWHLLHYYTSLFEQVQ